MSRVDILIQAVKNLYKAKVEQGRGNEAILLGDIRQEAERIVGYSLADKKDRIKQIVWDMTGEELEEHGGECLTVHHYVEIDDDED
ncbi:hypothetical protein FACS189472_11170 [Alphaproteobacteria bacterium]|nr:hypothetical protein FACS189472_11170 [Alphaproteobacteria bacterium]